MEVNTKEASKQIITCIKAGLPVFMHGSPGIGKSDIAKEIAEYFKLKLIDIRLSQCDPTDLAGFPSLDNEKKKASYKPMNIWPIEGDKIPKGYQGFLVLLDEFNSASLAVQAAAYKIILDKYVGMHKLHPNTIILCLGNKKTDNAIVNKLSTAMQSRLVHLELVADYKLWLEWAATHNIDSRIMAYIDYQPSKLFMFDPNHNDNTFPCPRTWMFLSKILKQVKDSLTDYLPAMAGTIGEGTAREFLAFTSIYSELPKYKDIVAAPTSINFSTQSSMMFALVHMLAEKVNEKDLSPVVSFLNRLPIEFTTIGLQTILRKHKDYLQHPAIQNWITTKGCELF